MGLLRRSLRIEDWTSYMYMLFCLNWFTVHEFAWVFCDGRFELRIGHLLRICYFALAPHLFEA